MNEEFEKISKYMSDKGFVYGPEPEIYQGVAGFFTYGPLGKLMKNNLENEIRYTFQQENFYEVECPLVTPEEVWEASGHTKSFNDPIIKCKKCKSVFRADKLIEDKYPDTEFSDILKFIKEKEMKCPNCSGEFEDSLSNHNLMMPTQVGLDKKVFLRGETATTSYLPFKRYTTFFRDKLPFGIFQIGKAFRNEISPRNGIIRQREFTQAEGQLFIFKDEKDKFEKFDEYQDIKLSMIPHENQKEEFETIQMTLREAHDKGHITNKAYGYGIAMAYNIFKSMGFDDEHIRFRQHRLDERAFYALDAWDLEIKTNSLGWMECCGIHDRGDYDLNQHSKHSGKELSVRNEEKKEKEIPHVIEIAFGVDRPFFSLLDLGYINDEKRGNVVMNLKDHISPIKAVVLPLVNKLHNNATELYQSLLKNPKLRNMKIIYDKSGSVGRRYARADEIGVSKAITFDFDSIEDKKVTIRDIKTTNQERIPIDTLADYLLKN